MKGWASRPSICASECDSNGALRDQTPSERRPVDILVSQCQALIGWRHIHKGHTAKGRPLGPIEMPKLTLTRPHSSNTQVTASVQSQHRDCSSLPPTHLFTSKGLAISLPLPPTSTIKPLRRARLLRTAEPLESPKKALHPGSGAAFRRLVQHRVGY